MKGALFSHGAMLRQEAELARHVLGKSVEGGMTAWAENFKSVPMLWICFFMSLREPWLYRFLIKYSPACKCSWKKYTKFSTGPVSGMPKSSFRLGGSSYKAKQWEFFCGALTLFIISDVFLINYFPSSFLTTLFWTLNFQEKSSYGELILRERPGPVFSGQLCYINLQDISGQVTLLCSVSVAWIQQLELNQMKKNPFILLA